MDMMQRRMKLFIYSGTLSNMNEDVTVHEYTVDEFLKFKIVDKLTTVDSEEDQKYVFDLTHKTK